MPGTVRKNAKKEQHQGKKVQKDQAGRDRNSAKGADCTVTLGADDANLTAHLLKNPPAPNDRLLQAAQRYRDLVR
ncbi:MAG TPA: hypothetical protein VFG50_17335 [Rhodothermales bacterium]|nr:hypothetical protein [Rhodothermales bacterium]